jgi:hypothetical protein
LLLASLIAGGSACHRHTTRLPGVLDLRSDASGARAVSSPPPTGEAGARPAGLDLVLGPGVEVSGSSVRVTDRGVQLRGLVPLLNNDADEEMRAAAALTGGIRDLSIHESMTSHDVLLAVLAQWLPLGVWFIPTFTFEAHGELIDVRGPAFATPAVEVQP